MENFLLCVFYYTLKKDKTWKKKKTQTYGYFQPSPNNSPSILHRLNINSLGANSTLIFTTENIHPEWFHKKTKDIYLEGKKIKPLLFTDGMLLHTTLSPLLWTFKL